MQGRVEGGDDVKTKDPWDGHNFAKDKPFEPLTFNKIIKAQNDYCQEFLKDIMGTLKVDCHSDILPVIKSLMRRLEGWGNDDQKKEST